RFEARNGSNPRSKRCDRLCGGYP
ncbi:bacterioferritin, partial [Vibrio harveyi]